MHCSVCRTDHPDAAVPCASGPDVSTKTISPSLSARAAVAPGPHTITRSEGGSSPGFISRHALARWVMACLLISGLLTLLALGSDASQLRLLLQVTAGDPVDLDIAQATDRRQQLVRSLHLVVLLTTGLFFLIWQHRVHRNLPALGAAHLRFSPGWAVGWWFVPLMNLVRPYQAIKELWRASDPDVDPLDPGAWRTTPTTPVLPWWWVLCLLSTNAGHQDMSRVLSVVAPSGSDGLDQLIWAYGALLASGILGLGALVCTLVLVRGVDTRQDEKHRRLGRRTPRTSES
jgi:Domain of unknown function (DUF4328)